MSCRATTADLRRILWPAYDCFLLALCDLAEGESPDEARSRLEMVEGAVLAEAGWTKEEWYSRDEL